MKTQIQGDRGPAKIVEECSECGMHRAEWPHPKGYTEDGRTYCCEGCATGEGCTCTTPDS